MSEKHIVCKGATVYCNKSMVNNYPGTAIPLTILSNTLVEINGGKVAATDKDCTPANMCFGNCKTGSNPPPPCVANVQWSKFYENAEVTEAGLKLLTEESEATCMTFGGKVKIAFHGQVATPQPEEAKEIVPEIMLAILPVNPKEEEMYMDDGKGESNKKITDAYWIDEETMQPVKEVRPGKKVNFCFRTSGYVHGEQASITLKSEEGEEFANGGNELTVSGEVDADGFVIIKDFSIDYK